MNPCLTAPGPGGYAASPSKVLQPDDKNASHVPVCRQFAPNQPWHELIPSHPSPPEMPEWLKEQILHLVKDANRHGSDRNHLSFSPADRWGQRKLRRLV